ncbi:RING-type domain-containing protein [Mycena venus]|uniref:RING-type domain-containing protein n=1 Tax=Mycena venus TaxID=2733690 RepID=A0A8H6XN14_9AGAR|nr:RING-type domain-containing protein [Mycena venus]
MYPVVRKQVTTHSTCQKVSLSLWRCLLLKRRCLSLPQVSCPRVRKGTHGLSQTPHHHVGAHAKLPSMLKKLCLGPKKSSSPANCVQSAPGFKSLKGRLPTRPPRPEAATSSARGSPRMGDTNLQPGPFVTLHSRAGRATILVTDHPLQSGLNLRPRPGPIGSHSGWRRSTARGVAQSQLLLSGPKPPTLTAKEPHHKCSICHCVKTHPVSTQCGHTHCFVCIRVWLQTSWKCPDCNTVMHSAPSRNYDLEEWLRISYPEIAADESRVTYSWSGLVFPTAN